LKPLEECNCGLFFLEFEYDWLFDRTYFLEVRGGFVVCFVDFEIVACFPLSSDVDIDKEDDNKNEKCEKCIVHWIIIWW